MVTTEGENRALLANPPPFLLWLTFRIDVAGMRTPSIHVREVGEKFSPVGWDGLISSQLGEWRCGWVWASSTRGNFHPLLLPGTAGPGKISSGRQGHHQCRIAVPGHLGAGAPGGEEGIFPLALGRAAAVLRSIGLVGPPIVFLLVNRLIIS
jgi:hypothetical protein